MSFDRGAILRWYTGKNQEKASIALDQIEASIAQGYWVKGVSRSCVATLKKANVAIKVAKTLPSRRGLFDLDMALRYGDKYVLRVDIDAMRKVATTEAEKSAVEAGAQYVAALRPVYSAMARLDATRPQPVITSLGVSPTVTETLQGLKLNPTTVRMCPIEWFEVARTVINKQGKEVEQIVRMARLLWPEGTQHNTSPYYHNAQHRQCQACGHAIKNDYNWAPLVVDGIDGVPRSLWVGRDCAQKLFGIKVSGELEIEGGRGSD
jgi:hypothetical protein